MAEKTDALIKTLEIYAETDKPVTQHFYQGLCLSTKTRLIELKAENAKLKEKARLFLLEIKEVEEALLGLEIEKATNILDQALKGE